ncbi:MAG: glycosyltransferase family 4 protein, partial [bacterium]
SEPVLVLAGKVNSERERETLNTALRDFAMAADTVDLGFVSEDDLRALYAESAVFLFPSLYEGFGLPVLEAMAAGTPVVATNAGGIPEIITHGKNGYLSEIGNVEQMSNHAISILGNNVTLEAFSAAARKQAETFDIHNIVPKYEQLYQKVLNK